jgi:hypothetical protein
MKVRCLSSARLLAIEQRGEVRCLDVPIFRMFDTGELSFHPRHRSEAHNYSYRYYRIMSRKIFLKVFDYYFIFCRYLYHFRCDGVN